MPDPRSAGREAIGPVLLEIVAAEGPILAERAYRLYVKASGGKALTSIARAPLSGATFRLRQAGAIEIEEGSEVLRPAGTPRSACASWARARWTRCRCARSPS